MIEVAMKDRRYDIDALRVIAIGLLLLYHTAIGFQAWGFMVGFITSSSPIPSLWPAMAMLNVWRIPLLFFVSGMGVYFAIQNRDWKQLLKERSKRILLPFTFGLLLIVPIHMVILQYHYGLNVGYSPHMGHLWFLGNIFLYVLILSPVFFLLKKHEESPLVTRFKKIFSQPFGLLLVIAVLMLELSLVRPNIYEMYAMTWHGFFMGMIAFFFGFSFVFSGKGFWDMIQKWKWLFLLLALGLFAHRLYVPMMRVAHFWLVVESCFWIFSLLAFGSKYLNKSSKSLTYLNQAAYPVYIIHMVVLYLNSALIFPLEMPVYLKFLLVAIGTMAGSLLMYEYAIRRVKVLRPLFGLRYE